MGDERLMDCPRCGVPMTVTTMRVRGPRALHGEQAGVYALIAKPGSCGAFRCGQCELLMIGEADRGFARLVRNVRGRLR